MINSYYVILGRPFSDIHWNLVITLILETIENQCYKRIVL